MKCQRQPSHVSQGRLPPFAHLSSERMVSARWFLLRPEARTTSSVVPCPPERRVAQVISIE